MIKLELEVTPQQLSAIAGLLYSTAATGQDTSLSVDALETPRAEIETPRAEIETPRAEIETPRAEETVADVYKATSDVITDNTPDEPQLAKSTTGKMIEWDERIHASTKKINADGSWRLKQNVDRENYVPEIEAEILGDTPPPPPAPTQVDQEPTPPPPPAAEPSKPMSFTEFLPLVTAAKASGELTDDEITTACKSLGLDQFGLIATRPHLIPDLARVLGV